MYQMTLKRVASNPHRTFGVLLDDDGDPFAVTLEDPWNGNETDISCIRPGRYICRKRHSPRHGDTYEVTNVEGRTHILFHVGNTEENTKGCILVGEEFGYLGGDPAIINSGKGYREFMRKLFEHPTFLLNIRDYT